MSKKIDDYHELPGFELKELPTFVKTYDEEQGVVEHFVAIFGNVDEGGDRIMPGAFRKSILERGRRVKVLDMHSTDSVTRIVGKPLALRETERSELTPEVLEYAPDATGGLLATTQYAIDTTRGSDVFKLVKGGFAPESSIGYDAITADYVKEMGPDGKERTVRLLKELRLWEYSNVVFGMNPATSVRSAKAADPAEVKPWNVFHEDGQWCVYRLDEDGNRIGESLDCYDTEEEARQQVEALYANEGKADPGPDAFKFTGSPRNPYGTHASRGYPGGRSAWKRAWRIHLSGIRDQGPVQGTVRRVSMIAAGMKPACKLPDMSAEDVGPRSGACGKLSGDYKETPGDYNLSQWKDPGDDNLTREDIQLTCQDLEDLKRICLQEIAKRQACSEEKAAREGDWDEDAPPGEGKAENLSERVEDVRQAFSAQYNPPTGPWHYWVNTVYDEYVVVSYEGDQGTQWFQVPYTREEERIAFAPRGEWVEGTYEFTPGQKAEDKAGRVLAARNAQRIRDAVSLLTEALKDAGLIEEEEQEKAGIYGMKPPIPLAYDEEKGHVIFPSGTSVYANHGFGGVPSNDLVPYGSDGAVDLKSLNAAECVQLADYVIYKWLEFRNKYTNDAPGESRAADDKEQDGPPSPTSDEAGPQGESPAPEGSDDIGDQVLNAEIEGLELELRLMEV